MDECMYLLQVDKEDTLKFKSQCDCHKNKTLLLFKNFFSTFGLKLMPSNIIKASNNGWRKC